ncbi:hypothetical protein E8E13_001675 [Curvularia kusanoi]|uniref:Uncharacterized protein n=1 Tax=Curvularia kusanoi TaxID=90978 RepID=A0A9P4TEF4_CURKU|nr:hypothetical protein E8E13_001675 [Curvularia kusanoi]
MPRNGDGSSDNGPFEEAGHDIVHGAGPKEDSRVARADNTAPFPEHGKGGAIEGMKASGGGYTLPEHRNQGKGPLEHVSQKKR